MPLYKQVVLTNLKSPPKDVARVFQDCAAIITSKGGIIRSTENCGEKRLGYGIEDRRWGALQRHYESKVIVQQFTTSAAVLKEVETKLKNCFPVIRFQTFKVRDPLDKLMNTRMTLEEAQLLLNPAAKAKALQAAREAKRSSRTHDSNLADVKPEDFFDQEEENEAAQYKQYVPEWKRDALFEPDVPAHLKTKVHEK
ncbi:putative ribosomal protein S6 [Plasmopara halstedii]